MTVAFSDVFKNHKLIHEFNKSEVLDGPEWIFLGERHRINYDPQNDRRLNNLALELLSDGKTPIFVENPSDTKIVQSAHPQTKDWTGTKRIYGCFDPEAFNKVKAIHDFFFQLIHLFLNFKSVALTHPQLQSLIDKQWLHEWNQKRFSFPHKEMNEETYKQTLANLIRKIENFKNKMINSGHMAHAKTLVGMLEKHSEAPLIIVLVGKNHLYIPKKLNEVLKEYPNLPDELGRSVSFFHEFLKKSGKWCVILKPVRQKHPDTD